ncbi:MAG: glutaminase A [Alphaproteobacteria bacterium]|nr:glutaminase A [Alphaproteobacteria bacterium]
MDKLYSSLFQSLLDNESGLLDPANLVSTLTHHGLCVDHDVRLRGLKTALSLLPYDTQLTQQSFSELAKPHLSLLEKALKGQLIIPDFEHFTAKIRSIFDRVATNHSGKVADYIPQLARTNPDYFAVTVCSTDGQIYSLGDSQVQYSVQSTFKPINYCIALELLGEEMVHAHMGREPSGLGFNALTLNAKGLPHNPMINAGAIMGCSLIQPELPLADRFDHVMSTWSALAGHARIDFNNSVCLAEKDQSDRNAALAHFMREKKAFLPHTNIRETLDFYFQCCSIEVSTSIHAQIAATLANAGVCPFTSERVFSNDTLKHCLSLMYSCGMYEFSGEFAFSVGIPAKSGASGTIMLVIPGIAGIVIYSPRLDDIGNSVRGVEFSKELVKHFNFHNYDSFSYHSGKDDPCHPRVEQALQQQFALIAAASRGDLHEIRRLISLGTDINQGDYDGRTALHLAVCENQLATVQFLIDAQAVIHAKDRWGASPVDDAKRLGYKTIEECLISC